MSTVAEAVEAMKKLSSAEQRAMSKEVKPGLSAGILELGRESRLAWALAAR